jgi:hypothetical protein
MKNELFESKTKQRPFIPGADVNMTQYVSIRELEVENAALRVRLVELKEAADDLIDLYDAREMFQNTIPDFHDRQRAWNKLRKAVINAKNVMFTSEKKTEPEGW